MGGDPLCDSFSVMNGSPILQQDHRTLQMPKQVTQEGSDIQPHESTAAQPEIERHALARGRHSQGADRGDPILFVQIAHDRRAAFRRPGAGHIGDEHKTGFIEEDQMGAPWSGVFLYAASGTVSIGRSRSRSAAARSVRGSDNSIPTGSGASRHDRDGSVSRTAGGSAAPHVSRSINRCDSSYQGPLHEQRR